MITYLKRPDGTPAVWSTDGGKTVTDGRRDYPVTEGLREELTTWMEESRPIPAACLTPACREAIGDRRYGRLVREGVVVDPEGPPESTKRAPKARAPSPVTLTPTSGATGPACGRPPKGQLRMFGGL